MNLNRSCPFCGTEEQELVTVAGSSPLGIPKVVQCIGCGAATESIYCTPDNFDAPIKEWKEGSILLGNVTRVDR